MRRVILESPYAGSSRYFGWFQRWRNRIYARRCVRDSLSRGEAPVASHMLYTQRGILRDHVPSERRWGIDAGLAWRAVADASVVYVDRGISPGMRLGINAAKAAGLTVEYRFLGIAGSQVDRPYPRRLLTDCQGELPCAPAHTSTWPSVTASIEQRERFSRDQNLAHGKARSEHAGTSE